jgi:transcriptional regulator with XRE-family HTH domain
MRCNGVEIARLRKAMGYSQQDLADKSGRSKSTIERVERGSSVDYQTVHDIRAVLGVRFDELILSEDGDDADNEGSFVLLTPPGSARNLMDLLLRCDTAAIDLEDEPAEESTMAVILILQQLEALLPGNPNTESDTLSNWRTSAAERLRGGARVRGILADLAAAGLHLLAGEYVAHLNEEETDAAVQNYVDEMELADAVYFSRPQQPDYRKRVAMLRVVKRGRTQMKVKPADMVGTEEASPPTPGSDANDIPF